MADAKKKQLVFNIIDFLRTSAQDGTVKEDDKESLEVAVQCVAESFGVDPDSDKDVAAYSIKPASLLSILEVYLKTKAKSTTSTSPSTNPIASTSTTVPVQTPKGPSEADKAQAESLKAEGNSLMSKKLYDSAIEKYTSAIELVPTPVYYSNRAAAWGGLGEHGKAVEDAEKALELDPKFAKAYSRLGHANFSQGAYEKAIKAYEEGLKLDPSNSNMKTALGTAKIRYAEELTNPVIDREPSRSTGTTGGMPDLSSLAGLMGGGGGGAGGGMPDIAAMMRNPQMMAMAQQMMANGGLERLMSNPTLRGLAENMQNGGGMPDMSALASDPSLRDLASQFMGPGGAGRGAE